MNAHIEKEQEHSNKSNKKTMLNPGNFTEYLKDSFKEKKPSTRRYDFFPPLSKFLQSLLRNFRSSKYAEAQYQSSDPIQKPSIFIEMFSSISLQMPYFDNVSDIQSWEIHCKSKRSSNTISVLTITLCHAASRSPTDAVGVVN